MPDTLKNQTAYPQHTAQKEGLGFPIMRMVVLLPLATAMIGGMAMGPYEGGMGKGDHVVAWPRPAKPDWMDAETY